MAHELTINAIPFQMQVQLPVRYKGIDLDCGYRIDMVIRNQVVVELKSVERLLPIHDAQLLTYMKLAKLSTGLLINFNTSRLVDGIRRLKN